MSPLFVPVVYQGPRISRETVEGLGLDAGGLGAGPHGAQVACCIELQPYPAAHLHIQRIQAVEGERLRGELLEAGLAVSIAPRGELK